MRGIYDNNWTQEDWDHYEAEMKKYEAEKKKRKAKAMKIIETLDAKELIKRIQKLDICLIEEIAR